jgi:UTP--glucose-1-phosphate uridylyltransferase
MGSAITVFEDAGAIRVPRTRFAPVKTTNDLLAVRSDVYLLTEDYHVIPNPARQYNDLVIDLDPHYYHLINEMEARFSNGVPSLIDCEELRVKGDVKFGKNVKLKGRVNLVNLSDQQKIIADDTDMEGELEL